MRIPYNSLVLRLATLFLVVMICDAVPLSARTPAVSITALYRERMMLPAGSQLRMRLVDNNSNRVIASAMLDNPHVPVDIDLSYEPSNIDAAHTYTIAGRILVNGEPFFATDTPAKVITQGNPSHVELLLKRVTATSPMLLEDQQWTMVELRGHAVTAENPPSLELSGGRAFGFGGCNRFAGGYKADGDAIEFTAAASTMMACIQEHAMDTEGIFLKELLNVRYWKVSGSNLQLLDSNRKPLMQFRNAE